MFSGLDNPVHLLFIAVIAMVVLGPKRIPEVAQSLGSGIREFKASISGETSSDDTPSEPSQD